jgi:hypothetical protein
VARDSKSARNKKVINLRLLFILEISFHELIKMHLNKQISPFLVLFFFIINFTEQMRENCFMCHFSFNRFVFLHNIRGQCQFFGSLNYSYYLSLFYSSSEWNSEQRYEREMRRILNAPIRIYAKLRMIFFIIHT